MFTNYLKARDRWFALGLLMVISCAAGARTPQELSGQDASGWPKTFEARGSKIQGDFDDTTIGMPTWKNIWISQ